MDEERFVAALQARLRARRLKLGLTQTEVAVRAKLSLRRYQEFEGQGSAVPRFNPTLRTLLRLARALNTDVLFLLDVDLE